MRAPFLAVRLTFAVATLCSAAACKDDRPRRTVLPTAPDRPALTSRNLPSDAPTICVANVKHRDKLLAITHPTAANTRQISALDAVIEDVCK